MRISRRVMIAGMSSLAAIGAGRAAQYPDRPVNLIVPYPPGGPTDTMARIVGAELGTAIGQSVIVLNKPGAAGAIGTQMVARAAPDGYTLLQATSDFSTNPSTYAHLPYDTEKDFTAVGLQASSTLVLLVSPTIPVKTISELVAYAKEKNIDFSCATSVIGGNTYLASILFKQRTGIKITEIPYQGGAPALTDLMAGRVPLMFSPILPALPLIADGTVRALGVTTAKRTAAAPDIPPIADTLPGIDLWAWYGCVAPAKTPPEVVSFLSKHIDEIVHRPAIADRLVKLGCDPGGGTPAAFQSFIHDDIGKWATIAKAAGYQPQ
jgi:tripartite-type tricarboxylate transporter receptor subunit TctC